jgi:uncharacterized protein YbjT (DUF2867 family)
MPFKAGRKMSVALSQARRKTGIAVRIAILQDPAVLGAEFTRVVGVVSIVTLAREARVIVMIAVISSRRAIVGFSVAGVSLSSLAHWQYGGSPFRVCSDKG